MQHCPRCDRDLPLDAYHADKQGKPGHYCRTCRLEYNRQWRRARGIQPQKRRTCTHPGCTRPPAAKAGKYCSPEHRPQRELSTTYQAVHKRIRRERGPASEHGCVDCGQQANDWAYDHNDPDESSALWYGKTVTYSTKLEHYKPLCRSCHNHMDSPYEGSVLQQTNERRKSGRTIAGMPDPMPRPMTRW